MSNIEPTRPTATRMLAGILTWALIAGQVMQPVYAVLTPLGRLPDRGQGGGQAEHRLHARRLRQHVSSTTFPITW